MPSEKACHGQHKIGIRAVDSQQPTPQLPSAKFRLPKLRIPHSPPATSGPWSGMRGAESPDGPDLVYTRYGHFEATGFSTRDLAESDPRRDFGPPTHRVVFPGPTFTQAVVTPVFTLAPTASGHSQQQQFGVAFGEANPSSQADSEQHAGKRFQLRRSKTNCTVAAVFSAFGSTLPRSPTVLGAWQALQRQQLQQQQHADNGSSFGTNERPVDWVMKPLRRFHGDRKGQQRNQGPYSREFVVHARAPDAWLQMKLGGPRAG